MTEEPDFTKLLQKPQDTFFNMPVTKIKSTTYIIQVCFWQGLFFNQLAHAIVREMQITYKLYKDKDF